MRTLKIIFNLNDNDINDLFITWNNNSYIDNIKNYS